MPPRESIAPGWYPHDEGTERYWDGERWVGEARDTLAAPAPEVSPPPGWHPDPDDPSSYRYWDGQRWTDSRAPRQGGGTGTRSPSPSKEAAAASDKDPVGLPGPGWHADPDDPSSWRYWDGQHWTDNRAPRHGGGTGNELSNGWFVLAVLVPIAGIVLAIIEWSRGNTGRGFGFAAAGVLAFCIYAGIICANYSSCVDDAETLRELNNC